MKFKFKLKKRTKKKLIHGVRGSISIFLCLIITPFLSISLGLIEYARMQQVIELTNELCELTGISALSDYDIFMHNRFGLLATDQETDLSESAPLLNDNINALGNQVNIENVSVNGKLSLQNTQILKKQVIDFSELTAPTAVVMEDFKVQDLINKLNELDKFQNVLNTVNSIKDFTDSLKTVVTELENFQTAVQNIINSVNNLATSAEALANKASDLFTALKDDGILFSSDTTDEAAMPSIDKFTSNYIDDITSLVSYVSSISSDISTIKSQLDIAVSSLNNVSNAVAKAEENASSVQSSNAADADGSISQAANTDLNDVLNRLKNFLDEAKSALAQDVVDSAKDYLTESVQNALKSCGLYDFLEKYSTQLVSGNFLNNITDETVQDIKTFISTVYNLCNGKENDDLLNELISSFVPDVSSIIDFDFLSSQLSSALTAAENALVSKASEMTGLTDLIDVVRNLFNLDVFYENDLNAFVNIGTSEDSSYQDFLDAIGSMLNAAEDFANDLGGLDLLGALGAVWDLFKAIGDLLTSIFEIIGNSITSLAKLAGDLLSGEVQNVYERLLISAYMCHNLPNRTSWNDSEKALYGTGLTGFDYSDIPIASGDGQEGPDAKGFAKLNEMLNEIKNGSGNDKSFKGAELEYICAGTNSEIANQIFSFLNIYFLRLLLDLPSVFASGEVASVAAAANIASWAVYIIYVLIEPFCDTIILVNGEEVPLIRKSCWLTASGVGELISKLASILQMNAEMESKLKKYATTHAKDDGKQKPDPSVSTDNTESGFDSGLGNADYSTHMLIIILAFVTDDLQINRFKGIVELETAEYYRQKGKTFNMLNAYTAVEVSADATFNPFFDLSGYTGGTSLKPKQKISQMISY